MRTFGRHQRQSDSEKVAESSSRGPREDDNHSEEYTRAGQRKIFSSVMLAFVADVGSHIGHPQ